MKQLYYSILTLLRGHGSNIIKIISLTLGLFIGIILFARIAFELSFNRGYKDSDRLAVVLARFNSNGVDGNASHYIMGPVPRAIMENFPDQVEVATVTRNIGEVAYYVSNQRFLGQTTLADTLFFKTLGIDITSGDNIELAVPDNLFVSDDFARRVFGTTDVKGKTLLKDKKTELTIRGTFAAVPDNNSLRPDVVQAYHPDKVRNYSWEGGDSFNGYIRLREGADIEKINQRMNTVIEQYQPYEPEKNGWGVRFWVENMHEEYSNSPEVKRIIFIMSFLAIAVLLISAMNYVLISISRLSRRAKGIGVHKCNGASSGQIFNMFMWETGIIILISVIIVLLLILNLRGLIAELIEVRVTSLFTLDTLWVPLLVIAVIFILSAVIPGSIYAGIPVTQLFRKYTDRNSTWKRILLFVQFAGVAFIFGVLMVSFIQYKNMVEYDLGYDTKNMAISWVEHDNLDVAISSIRNLPMVEDIATSVQGAGNRYSGYFVFDENGKQLFSARVNYVSPEFINMHKFVIVEGRNVMGEDEVLVNEEYVRRMPWTDGAIGKKCGIYEARVVGILKDFVDNSLFEPVNPTAFLYIPQYKSFTVKLKEPFRESLMYLNRDVQELFPNADIIFKSVEENINDKYLSVRRFRDSAGVAFAVIMIIALIGLFGYINDEIQRRSKEIGIRKVNGAQASDILKILNKDIVYIALPAIILGTFFSYFIGSEWIGQFAGLQINLSIPFYILLILIMTVVIIATVIMKSWHVANDDPVNSIKND